LVDTKNSIHTHSEVYHSEVSWDIFFSENERSHSILIKWIDIQKLEKLNSKDKTYSIYYNSTSPITGQRIKFIDKDDNDICDFINLNVIQNNSDLLPPIDSSMLINLDELNKEYELDIFTKNGIKGIVEFKESRNLTRSVDMWNCEPFNFTTMLKASSIEITLHLPEIQWWKKALLSLFRISERKYFDTIWVPYFNTYKVESNKKGEIRLDIPERGLSPDSEIYYALPDINLKGSLLRLIGLISIGVIVSYLAEVLNIQSLMNII